MRTGQLIPGKGITYSALANKRRGVAKVLDGLRRTPPARKLYCLQNLAPPKRWTLDAPAGPPFALRQQGHFRASPLRQVLDGCFAPPFAPGQCRYFADPLSLMRWMVTSYPHARAPNIGDPHARNVGRPILTPLRSHGRVSFVCGPPPRDSLDGKVLPPCELYPPSLICQGRVR